MFEFKSKMTKPDEDGGDYEITTSIEFEGNDIHIDIQSWDNEDDAYWQGAMLLEKWAESLNDAAVKAYKKAEELKLRMYDAIDSAND